MRGNRKGKRLAYFGVTLKRVAALNLFLGLSQIMPLNLKISFHLTIEFIILCRVYIWDLTIHSFIKVH